MVANADFLDQLKSRLTLSAVVGRHLRLTRTGREFKACCPFHGEKTPSFFVNDEKGFYHCFGCGAHGDAIAFLQQMDNLEFPEAVARLAAEAGLEVPRPRADQAERDRKRPGLHELMEAAAAWYEGQLAAASGRPARAYLDGRGLDGESCRRFRLGYAPSDGAAFLQAMRAAGFDSDQLEEAGLMRRPGDGRPAFAFFRNRLIFPVTDRRGRVVAFGGRRLAGEGPKYINSPETPIFEKSRLLYNLPGARRAAGQGAPLLVVEGYTDVIACVRAGFEGAVAPLGTALTETQIALLWRMIPREDKVPVLCFDGDEAGRRAAARAVARLLPQLGPGLSARFAFLPEGSDPDSLIAARGPAALRAVIDAARPLDTMVWEGTAEGRELATPEQRAALKSALMAQLDSIPDRSVQSYYRQEMLRRLDRAFPPPWQNKGRASARPGSGAGAPGTQMRVAPPARPVRDKGDLEARILLAILINYPGLYEDFGDLLALMPMPDAELAALRDALVDVLTRDPTLDESRLGPILSARDRQAACRRVQSRATYTHAPFARPGGDPDEVAAACRRWIAKMDGAAMAGELEAARRSYWREGAEAGRARLDALKAQIKDDDEADETR